jgi:hypothetical protein
MTDGKTNQSNRKGIIVIDVHVNCFIHCKVCLEGK